MPRVTCKNIDCTLTILPSTAKATGGICMPCKKRAERGPEDDTKYEVLTKCPTCENAMIDASECNYCGYNEQLFKNDDRSPSIMFMTGLFVIIVGVVISVIVYQATMGALILFTTGLIAYGIGSLSLGFLSLINNISPSEMKHRMMFMFATNNSGKEITSIGYSFILLFWFLTVVVSVVATLSFFRYNNDLKGFIHICIFIFVILPGTYLVLGKKGRAFSLGKIGMTVLFLFTIVASGFFALQS
ncbi:MAG: hypothetical protein HRT89_16285 [Lentisphaeria bacterium]|nr:hypothetical protein [Lentisphaeria bacterium]NQZ69618.1 hypothetical protein [Lentisphaeria bacterium]